MNEPTSARFIWPGAILMLALMVWVAFMEARPERHEARVFAAANACFGSTRKDACASFLTPYIGRNK